MSWPEDSLDVRLEMAWGADLSADPDTWVWSDETAYWHKPEPVTVTAGRRPRGRQAETATFSISLKNTSGRYTPRDGRSPLWPHVTRDTPVRWRISTDSGSTWHLRFAGHVRRWPIEWPGDSARMAITKVTADGLLYRLGRGTPPAWSAMRRTITADPTTLAYWPVEDGASAGQVGSAIPGHPPLATADGVEFRAVDDQSWYQADPQVTQYGTSAQADLAAGASIRGRMPADVTAATTSEWCVEVASGVDVGLADGPVVVLEVTTPGGTYTRWRVMWLGALGAPLAMQAVAITPEGVETVVASLSGSYPSYLLSRLRARQVGGSIAVDLVLGGVPTSGSIAGTLAGVSAVAVNPTGRKINGEYPAGHISVHSTTPGYNPFDLLLSHWGDTAVARLSRVCAEERIALSAVPDPLSAATRMGWQRPATRLELLREVETTDGGYLTEQGFGLGYRTRISLENQPVRLTIDAAQRQLGAPFRPEEEADIVNDVTVEREGGSSARAATGGESVPDSVTVATSSDAVLADHAGWRLWLASTDEPQYQAEINLHTLQDAALVDEWLSMQAGDRWQIINPPPQHPPGPVDQLLDGWAETWRGRRWWRVQLVGSPASPWTVATVDGDQRVATDATTLAAGITATALTLTLSETWTADPADMPLDVRVGGEQVRLASITGTTATVATGGRGLNGVSRSWPSGTPVDVWAPAIAAL